MVKFKEVKLYTLPTDNNWHHQLYTADTHTRLTALCPGLPRWAAAGYILPDFMEISPNLTKLLQTFQLHMIKSGGVVQRAVKSSGVSSA